ADYLYGRDLLVAGTRPYGGEGGAYFALGSFLGAASRNADSGGRMQFAPSCTSPSLYGNFSNIFLIIL
ncbi:MAG: hypothetical protein AAGM67_03310, partial [Bacteroidota bacterium]